MVTRSSSIFKALTGKVSARTVIVGIGDVKKCDDGAGVKIAELIDGKVIAPVINCGRSPENHINPIRQRKPETVLMIDAIDMGLSPGSFKIINPRDIGDATFTARSASLKSFADLVFAETGAKVLILGIQPKKISFGVDLSEEVSRSAEKIAVGLEEVFSRHAS